MLQEQLEPLLYIPRGTGRLVVSSFHQYARLSRCKHQGMPLHGTDQVVLEPYGT